MDSSDIILRAFRLLCQELTFFYTLYFGVPFAVSFIASILLAIFVSVN